MGINIGYLTANRTSAGDEVYTPFYAVEPLTEFLPKDKRIWCPFDENWSAFYQYLSEQGYRDTWLLLHGSDSLQVLTSLTS